MNDNRREKWLDRAFQVFLVLLGFVMGVVGTQFVNYWETRSRKEEAAKLLVVLVRSESRKNNKFIKALEKMIEEQSPKMIVPEGLEWQHDLTLIYSVSEKISVLESEIIAKYIGYLRMYEQCGSFRDLVIRKLKKVDQSHEVDFKTIEAYLWALKGVERSGEELQSIVKKYYSI
jgi:hypothetical protein